MFTTRSASAVVTILLGMTGTDSTAQTVTGSFMHDGIQRDYRLYVPPIYNGSSAVPLVFNLHGYGSDASQQELYGDFRAIADTAGFLIALPNGTVDQYGNRHWDTFGASVVDDLGFISALLDTISAQYNIDADRVYSTGMSNGGFMSYDLACYRSERFAAIASVTGTMLTTRLTNCAAAHPTPVMQIHGTADPTVNYNGGSGFSAIEPLVEHWAQFNHCDPVPTITAVPDTNTTDGCTAEHFVYTGGDAGSTVEFYKVLGGGHTWPDAIVDIGVTNHDFNASREVWRFFSQYDLSTLVGIPGDRTAGPVFTFGPNPASGTVNVRFNDAAPRVITLVNSIGQTVLEQRSSQPLVRIEVDGRGLYLLSVQAGDRTAVQRLVID